MRAGIYIGLDCFEESECSGGVETIGVGDAKGNVTMELINLADKLTRFSEYWQRRMVGQFTGHDLWLIQPTGTPNTGDVATATVRGGMTCEA